MQGTRWWIGAACGLAVGVAVAAGVDASTGDAAAQQGVTVTAGQLQINQRISQAAVKRSNQALAALAPVIPSKSNNNSPPGWASSQIASNAITTSKIANEAVTNGKLAANAVTGAKIANDAVTNAKIGNNAVGSAQISNDAVTGAKIANGAVGQSQLSSAVQAQLGTMYTASATVAGTTPTLANSKGAGATVTYAGSTGQFNVSWGTTNISACTWVAAAASPNATQPTTAPVVTVALNSATQLTVQTHDVAGTPTNPTAFTVQVIC